MTQLVLFDHPARNAVILEDVQDYAQQEVPSAWEMDEATATKSEA